MEERRKNKRTSMPSRHVIKKVENGNDKEVVINIIDVSKSGIGFTCEEPLQIGEVYEAYLTIWTKEVIHAVLQIVRTELSEDGFGYGAVFMGMPPTDLARIEVYQAVSDTIGNDEDK